MKILINVYYLNDLGGIIPCTENLVYGLKKIGHKVTVVQSAPKAGFTRKSGPPERLVEDYYYKTSDRHAAFEKGIGTGYLCRISQFWWDMPKMTYADVAKLSEDCDLLIHMVPIPTPQSQLRGNMEWMKIYETCMAPQYAYIHDTNMQKLYPHILNVCDYLDGLICVHPAAYNSVSELPVDRFLIPNPHKPNQSRDHKYDMTYREHQIFNVQNFKRWKRADDLIRAVPHLANYNIQTRIGGGGIEQHYMSSITGKIKKEYVNAHGISIWDEALLSGFCTYTGYITSKEVVKEMNDARLVVDCSWSKQHVQYGSHFNRVIVEAMNCGAVPVATTWAMDGSSYFEQNKNYFAYDPDISPHDLAYFLETCIGDTYKLQRMSDANIALLHTHFKPDRIAKKVVDPHKYLKAKKGTPSDLLKANAVKVMEKFK